MTNPARSERLEGHRLGEPRPITAAQTGPAGRVPCRLADLRVGLA